MANPCRFNRIVVPREEGITWLTNRLGSQLRRKLSSILGHPVQIEIVATARQEEVIP